MIIPAGLMLIETTGNRPAPASPQLGLQNCQMTGHIP